MAGHFAVKLCALSGWALYSLHRVNGSFDVDMGLVGGLTNPKLGLYRSVRRSDKPQGPVCSAIMQINGCSGGRYAQDP